MEEYFNFQGGVGKRQTIEGWQRALSEERQCHRQHAIIFRNKGRAVNVELIRISQRQYSSALPNALVPFQNHPALMSLAPQFSSPVRSRSSASPQTVGFSSFHICRPFSSPVFIIIVPSATFDLVSPWTVLRVSPAPSSARLLSSRLRQLYPC